MTSNIDPKLRAYLAHAMAIREMRDTDDAAPIVVVTTGGQSLRMRNDIPATRGSCPTQRPCPHVRCEWHLWLTAGSDRAGRRYSGRTPPTELRRAYNKPSCGADLADAAAAKGEPMPIDDLADALGLKPSRVHEILATAIAKLKAAGHDVEALR